MNTTATIIDIRAKAKDSSGYYGAPPHTIISMQLDVKLPAPQPVKTLADWSHEYGRDGGASHVSEWERERREQNAKATGKRGKKNKNSGTTCPECHANFTNDEEFEQHDCPYDQDGEEEQDEEQEPTIPAECAAYLGPFYETYVYKQEQNNRAALAAAQEAALFLMLLKREVTISISPVQQGFGELLQLQAAE